MKRFKVMLCVVLVIITVISSGCSCGYKPKRGGSSGLKYDEFPTNYDANQDSWTQVDPDDEDVSVTWFTDYSYTDHIADLIYKRTGVKIKVRSATSTDHKELNTMIAGDSLPDIITIGDLATRIQLAEEGYVYSIDRLAESYAPSMLKRIPPEEKKYYAGSDGHMYGIASNFYADGDIEEFEDNMGKREYMNYDVVVRKDYLEEYIAYKTKENAQYNPDTDITRPDGFIEMVKWVKTKHKLSNANPTVCLSPFEKTATNDCFNYSLAALMEMFCVPYEDAQGNYVYQYDTPEFVEVMKFMNKMYNEKLIFSQNISYTKSDINGAIQRGDPVAFIGASQQHSGAFANWEKAGYNAQTDTVDSKHQYVSIVLTNSNGDAPLLLDFAGRGLYITMITANCKRPDRVIKVLDYMISEQGQREVMYGEEEGRYYNYVVRPGETDPRTGEPSLYGKMEWTEAAKELIRKNNITTLYDNGITVTTMLTNQLYKNMTSPDGYGINWLQSWMDYKHKCAYFDYAFSRVPFRYPLDTLDRNVLNRYADTQSDIEQVWILAYPRMIMAANETEMMKIYNEALKTAEGKGAKWWTDYRNTCFKKYKQELGIDFAWPKNDPDYKAPAVTLYGGTSKYLMDRPDYISYT